MSSFASYSCNNKPINDAQFCCAIILYSWMLLYKHHEKILSLLWLGVRCYENRLSTNKGFLRIFCMLVYIFNVLCTLATIRVKLNIMKKTLQCSYVFVLVNISTNHDWYFCWIQMMSFGIYHGTITKSRSDKIIRLKHLFYN